MIVLLGIGMIIGHEKTKSNEHWKEKVRQTLQRLAKSGVCKNTSRGYWSLAA